MKPGIELPRQVCCLSPFLSLSCTLSDKQIKCGRGEGKGSSHLAVIEGAVCIIRTTKQSSCYTKTLIAVDDTVDFFCLFHSYYQKNVYVPICTSQTGPVPIFSSKDKQFWAGKSLGVKLRSHSDRKGIKRSQSCLNSCMQYLLVF